MTEATDLSKLANKANGVYSSVTTNATAITAISIGGTTINSTSFGGTANNASYLGGTAAAGYQTTAGLSANVATLTANNASYLGGSAASSYSTTGKAIAMALVFGG